MKVSDILNMPPFFDRYINMCPDEELIFLLKKGISSFDSLEWLAQKAEYEYQAQKWSVKEVIQHIIDNERIQAYRALRISRGDTTVLPGYDENIIAEGIKLDKVSIEDLLTEFKALRTSNIYMFQNMTEQMLLNEGICFNVSISPLALGLVLVGHQTHHINVLLERYK